MSGRQVFGRRVRKMFAEAEAEGLICWTGEWRNGQKVYVGTEAGRRWAADLLAGPPEDDEESSP